jgi:drug/metabolite transporter (DMT)-like permease
LVTDPQRTPVPTDDADMQARLMLALLCVTWGITWSVVKIGLDGLPPFTMRTCSLGLGAATLFLVCLAKGRSFKIPNAKSWVHVFIASTLNVAGFTVISAFAQVQTTTSRVSVLAYTLPIWSVLLAWLFLGERPTSIQKIALALCAAGLAILIYPLTATGLPIGVFLAVLSGLSWGAGTVYLKWARIDADPMGVASWQITLAFLAVAAGTLLYQGGLDFSHATPESLVATSFSGIVGNGIAYGLWFEIVRRLPAATASLGVLGSPAVGVVASILILGERPTAPDVAGFALIFAASACVLLARPAAAVENRDDLGGGVTP